MRSLLKWFGLQGIQSTIKRIQAEKPKPVEKPKRVWTYEGKMVCAHTKSEARAQFKKARGLKRLPVGAVVRELTEVPDEAVA